MGKKKQGESIEKKTHDMLKEFEASKMGGLLGGLLKSQGDKEKKK